MAVCQPTEESIMTQSTAPATNTAADKAAAKAAEKLDRAAAKGER